MPLRPDKSRTWSQRIGLPTSSLVPLPRTSSVTPSFSAHATASRRSLVSRGLIVPVIALGGGSHRPASYRLGGIHARFDVGVSLPPRAWTAARPRRCCRCVALPFPPILY